MVGEEVPRMAGTNEIQGAPLLPMQQISEKKPVSGSNEKRGKTIN